MPAVAEITKNAPRGRPFPKGKSPNPGGRPKKTPEEVKREEACRAKTREALAVILDVMENSSNDRVRLAAAGYILDRGWGKARQEVEHKAELVISRSEDPQKAYIKMLEGGRLEELPDETA